MKKRNIAIIGGGHNGLVCACYLARAGHHVTIFERRHILGGAAVTESFYPGFVNSTASYTVGLLSKKIIQDLHLEENGLTIVPRPMNNFVPLENDYFRFGGEVDVKEEIARFSQKDAECYDDFMSMLSRVAKIFREFMWDTPPTTKGMRDAFQMLSAAGRLNKLPVEEQREIVDLFMKSADEIVSRYFESEPLKALLCWDSIVGNFASPYDNGTAYVLLHHVFGESTHGWGHAIGGMGSISLALEAEAMMLGVEFYRDVAVTGVDVKDGVVRGVCVGMSCFDFDIVVSSVHPKILYLDLIDETHLPKEFVERMKAYKSGSATFRINVALDDLPRFRCLPEFGQHYGAGILMMPSVEYMDRAYLDARRYKLSTHPIIEMLIPSVIDKTLAPPGKHVASLFCQHFDPKAEWDDRLRDQAVNRIFDTVESHMPGFKNLILGYLSLSPKDLEERFGLIGGDIFHGCLTLDQMYMNRPLLGYGNYRGPLKGLYMCGAGTHPGGGVTGIPGHNAAREILRDC